MSTDRRKFIAVFCSYCACSAAGAADVAQFGYDASHSGNNAAESVISVGNVSGLQQRYAVAFSGTDAPPVFLENVAGADGNRDLLFFTTVYGIAAIDAGSGKQVWVQSTGSFEYSTGTAPALDPNRQFIYGPGSDGRVHKLAVADGSETKDGVWPVVSSAKPAIEKSSSPLAIGTTTQGTYLYSVTASFNDADDYQGHLTAIDLATGAFEVFNAACSDLHVHFIAHGTAGVDDCASRKNGLWSRAGVTYDTYTNRIYLATGNGPFDANGGGHDWGDTVLALNPDGTGAANGLPLDSYTPAEYSSLDMLDIDLGSASPVVLPQVSGSAIPHLGAQIGKDGNLRLLDMDNLSRQRGSGHVGGELQIVSLLPGGVGALAVPQPAVWTDVHGDGSVWLFASVDGTLAGLQVAVSNGQPLFEQRWLQTNLSVTASPMLANGVLYAMTEGRYSASIDAIDPHTGAVLWTSPPIDQCCHTQGPIVANGRVFIGSNTVVAMFALTSSPPPVQDSSRAALRGAKPTRPAVRPPSAATQRRPVQQSNAAPSAARPNAIRKVLAVV